MWRTPYMLATASWRSTAPPSGMFQSMRYWKTNVWKNTSSILLIEVCVSTSVHCEISNLEHLSPPCGLHFRSICSSKRPVDSCSSLSSMTPLTPTTPAARLGIKWTDRAHCLRGKARFHRSHSHQITTSTTCAPAWSRQSSSLDSYFTCIRIDPNFDSFELKCESEYDEFPHLSRRSYSIDKSPCSSNAASPMSLRKDIGRSESLRVVTNRTHRIFRPSDLIHGEVLGKGCYGQAIKVGTHTLCITAQGLLYLTEARATVSW